MNSQFLRLVIASAIATWAIALPSVSWAEDLTGSDATATPQEVTDATPEALDNQQPEDAENPENAEEPITRGGASIYRRNRTNRINRPPSATDVNNARNRVNFWWFN